MATKLTILIISLATFLMFSCTATTKHTADRKGKNKQELKKSKDMLEGTLVDLTNLDGCGWVIKFANGTKIQPLNLGDFDIELIDGMIVFVKYRKSDLVGTCMAGDVVELESIIQKTK